VSEYQSSHRALPDGRTEVTVRGFDGDGQPGRVKAAHYVLAKALETALAKAETAGLTPAPPAPPN